MKGRLDAADWAALVRRVFLPQPVDQTLAVVTDLPDAAQPDHPEWAARREMAAGWWGALSEAAPGLGVKSVQLAAYRNVGRNNADLPPSLWVFDAPALPADANAAGGGQTATAEFLSRQSIVIAPTEFSATAPLKLAARRLGFRAATMPGFNAAMLPALRLDYEEIHARCEALKARLDAAAGARAIFCADGMRHELFLDLRHRSAHASGGLIREPGTAGNLPSGEAYIVPYEGEHESDPSRSAGELPLQLDGELLIYRIAGNRVVDVLGDGPRAAEERSEMQREPAYRNIAELGLGVLSEYGVRPIGQLLLDEKLGLHIAFGRSDHFGGSVGAAQFSAPDRVVHIDRVYLPELQPAVRVEAVDLVATNGTAEPLMRDGRYV